MVRLVWGGWLALLVCFAATPRCFGTQGHGQPPERLGTRAPAPLTKDQENSDLKNLQSLADSLQHLGVTGNSLNAMPTMTTGERSPAPRSMLNP